MHTATFLATIRFNCDVERLEQQISAVITQIPRHWTVRAADIEAAANLFCAPSISEGGCCLTYDLPLGSETRQGLLEAISALREFCDKKIGPGTSFAVKQTGGAEPPVVVNSYYGVKDAVLRMIGEAGHEDVSRIIRMNPIEAALRHVRQHHPAVTHVFFNGDRKWLFCDDTFGSAQLGSEVDHELISLAAESLQRVPAGFHLNDFS